MNAINLLIDRQRLMSAVSLARASSLRFRLAQDVVRGPSGAYSVRSRWSDGGLAIVARVDERGNVELLAN